MQGLLEDSVVDSAVESATLWSRVMRPCTLDNRTIPASDSSSFYSALSRHTPRVEDQTPSPSVAIRLPVWPSPTHQYPMRSTEDLPEPPSPIPVFCRPLALEPEDYLACARYKEPLMPIERPPTPLSTWFQFIEDMISKYPGRVMGYDRIEVIHKKYIEEKNA